jgi:ribosomal protein S12 methylthiotransferase
MRYWLETLGCPKNQVDSDKLGGRLAAGGYLPAPSPESADLVVVNTCAFIEAARQESVDTILELADRRRSGARLVVTGCMAERYGTELADALPEIDIVAGFGVEFAVAPTARTAGLATPVTLGVKPAVATPLAFATAADAVAVPSFDLLELPRPPAGAPWAYVKIAEGCNRHCGFCAIPSFRGRQRSRGVTEILAEVDALDVKEVVLVAQDLASYGIDDGRRGAIVGLVEAVAARVDRVRLLYLYPSELSASLISVMGQSGCPYFDLSLQHVSKANLRRMRRWGDGPRFLARIRAIRSDMPDAAFRSSFILGYPGETEDDHDQLLRFLDEAELDWAGFFPFSREEGTYAADLPDQVPAGLAAERLAECAEIQDRITARARQALVGTTARVLVDSPGVARSHREAPEIDGVISVPMELPVGEWATVAITAAAGPDLEAGLVPAPDLEAGLVSGRRGS